MIDARNTESVRQELERSRDAVLEQQLRVDGLCSAVATLVQRVAELELALNLLRSRVFGHGPSET
jgi:hypothetical protein